MITTKIKITSAHYTTLLQHNIIVTAPKPQYDTVQEGRNHSSQ